MSYKRILILILTGLFWGGCKSVAVLPTKAPVNKVDLRLLAKEIQKQHPQFNHLRGRLKATYDNGKNKQQVVVSLRMTQNQKIWMSANMLIPIAKLMTPRGSLKDLQPTYFVNPTTFLLKEQRFVLPQGQNILSFKYPEYQNVGGQNLPKRVEISYFDGKQLLQLQLQFSRLTFPKKITFPFEIPEGYQPIVLK
jgi:hypothetical protein